MSRKISNYVVLGAIALLAVIQFIQPERTNPPANPASGFAAVAKPSPEVAAIFRRVCKDCHSNETTWPWYSWIAPVSWLVADDVKEGRAHMNLSEWSFLSPEASMSKLKDACREVKSGGMPMWQYRLVHPEARLTAAEIDTICSASGSIALQR